MKTKLLSLLSFLVLCLTSVFSQSLSGRVYYQASNQLMFRIDSADMSPTEITEAQELMKMPWQRDFVLTFTQAESNWQQIPGLGKEAESSGSDGTTIMLSGTEDNMLYKNLPEQSYTQEQEFMGREFLIRDKLTAEDWELSQESKKIGDYVAQKATYSKIVDSQRFSTGMEEMEAVKDTIQVTVWYTQEIPVAHGPENYFGLPGLILEVHNGGRAYYCKKIELNPSADPVVIRVPKQGKEMTNEQFQAMQQESIRQMEDQYQGKPGGKNRRKVSIGG